LRAHTTLGDPLTLEAKVGEGLEIEDGHSLRSMQHLKRPSTELADVAAILEVRYAGGLFLLMYYVNADFNHRQRQ
jgi:hypothetical protein